LTVKYACQSFMAANLSFFFFFFFFDMSTQEGELVTSSS